jgi:hypothetical protein
MLRICLRNTHRGQLRNDLPVGGAVCSGDCARPTLTPAKPSPPAAVSTVEEEWPFDKAFGVALTSDYVSRGITNTDSHPALQGYIEPGVGSVYVNTWSSNVDYGAGFEGTEIDVGVGYSQNCFHPAECLDTTAVNVVAWSAHLPKRLMLMS